MHSISTLLNTVEPLYNGHIETSKLVLLMEVFFIEGSFNITEYQNGTRQVPLVVRCSLFRGVLYKGFTVLYYCVRSLCIMHGGTYSSSKVGSSDDKSPSNHLTCLFIIALKYFILNLLPICAAATADSERVRAASTKNNNDTARFKNVSNATLTCSL